MRGRQFRRTYPDRVSGEICPIDSGRIVEHRRQTLRPHILANPLDHLLRRKRLAEHLDRPPPAGFADDISTRAQPFAQLGQCLPDVRLARIDS